ncbi:MAG TPA: hypothetical protein VGI75_13810 [Pirellulales bacterium]
MDRASEVVTSKIPLGQRFDNWPRTPAVLGTMWASSIAQNGLAETAETFHQRLVEQGLDQCGKYRALVIERVEYDATWLLR